MLAGVREETSQLYHSVINSGLLILLLVGGSSKQATATSFQFKFSFKMDMFGAIFI